MIFIEYFRKYTRQKLLPGKIYCTLGNDFLFCHFSLMCNGKLWNISKHIYYDPYWFSYYAKSFNQHIFIFTGVKQLNLDYTYAHNQSFSICASIVKGPITQRIFIKIEKLLVLWNMTGRTPDLLITFKYCMYACLSLLKFTRRSHKNSTGYFGFNWVHIYGYLGQNAKVLMYYDPYWFSYYAKSFN